MPLLNKIPFERKEIRENLKDEEEVYYCSVTDEIFENYEDFCERVLLVNSVIWSCGFTGKSNMTFDEAAASEEHSRSLLKDFPVELRIPALYLASLTQRTSLENLAEDVFSFAKERYFVGESVEVNFKGDIWSESHVIQVIPPEQKEIDSHEDHTVSRYEALPSALFRCEVEAYEQSDSGEQVVAANKIRRKKGIFTRDRNRLYLKQFAEAGQNGVWKIKNEALQKYGIPRVKFENIFIGKPPVFQASKNTRKPQTTGVKSKQKVPVNNNKQNGTSSKKEKRQESIERYLTVSNNQNKKKTPTKGNGPVPTKKTPQKQMAQKVKEKYRNTGGVTKKYKKSNLVPIMSVEKLQLLREQQKERALEVRKKKLEEKVIERAKLKEEKRRLAEFMKQWNRQREDLECEDLKPLPLPVPVECKIPNEYFGDFLMILEFFHNFSEALTTKDCFPYGMTFDLVERALSEKEVAGPFSDMLQFLLTAVFTMQDEEDEEVLDYTTAVDLDIDERVDVTTSEGIRLATAAASWSQQYQGTPLSKLPLDSVTVTEVLRLHLLSSGGRCSDTNAKWRYQQRGGYTSRDDPGFALRMQSPHILKALGYTTVFELPLGDKLKIMTCLMNQILTYAALRDIVDDRCEKTRVLKIELKVQQLACIKREKELTALRIKQRKDAKLKLRVVDPSAPVSELPPTLSDEPVVSEAELADRISKLEKELIRRQADMIRKSSELNAVSMGHRVVPLGTDRAHRRYWLFNSCPGLFVEHDSTLVGPCLLKPTPYNPALENANDTVTYVRRLFEEEKCNGGSDKENEAFDEKVRLATSPKKIKSDPIKSEAIDEENHANVSLVCTANDMCSVHGNGARTKWSFFSKEIELSNLLEGLNVRGIREGELRQNLVDESQKIVQIFSKCSVQKLNRFLELPPGAPEERKTSRSNYSARYMDANLNFPNDMAAADIFELTLRDLILDLEDKISNGGLGSIKVHDRVKWRAALNERGYDKQCEKLSWGGQQLNETSDDIPIMKASGRVSRGSSRPVTPAVDAMDHDGVKHELLDYRDPGRFLSTHDLVQNPIIRDLASAMLQVEMCIEKKYRQKPLAPDDDDWSPIHRWEVSLMSSTGLSQLFVHYYTLESSIQWSKSALNATCRLCRRRGDGEKMLLCDECNKGHHMYCLKPKLTKVPTGDWFCPKCRPQVKTPRTARKRRTIFLEEEEEELDEEVPNDEEVQIPVEVCDSCNEGGHVICCDTESCARVFHIECLVPPLKKVPRGKWYCPKCKQREQQQPSSSKDGVGEWQAKEPSPSRNRRYCATAAVAKISEFAKRIRSRSWDNDSGSGSVGSTHSDELQPSRRSARMSLEPDLDLPLNNALLQDLLTEVMHNKDAWPFLRPVPRAQVPDYHIIIKRPMDLGTMKNKLNMLNYSNNSEFIADANLVFENCKMYNHYDAVEYKAGVRLRRFFERRCRELGLQLAIEGDAEEEEEEEEDKGEDEEPEKKRPRISDK